MVGWVEDELPAVDVIVMMRLDSKDYPLWPGHHDGNGWHACSPFPAQGTVITGWMTLDDAAKALDKQRSR